MILDPVFKIVDVATGDDDEDDDGNSDWLYDLQEPGGERFTYSEMILVIYGQVSMSMCFSVY